MGLSAGRTVRLFLVDGAATGLMTAEILSWTGRALVAPRSRLPDVLRRQEARGTGVYFLVGDDPKVAGQQLVYIGKSTNIGERIRSHDTNKDFWDRLCIVTSKDQNLTEAHVGFLESRLIARATEAGRASVENSTAPDYRSLPESDIADMSYWVEQISLLLPVLGFDFLREVLKAVGVQAPPMSSAGASADRLELELRDAKFGVVARAIEVDGEYVVLEGSTARSGGDYFNSYAGLRQQLIDGGKLVKTDDPQLFRFVQDVTFTSPSAASAVILNRNDNGRTSWHVKGSNVTLAQWQDQQAERAAEATKDDEDAPKKVKGNENPKLQ
jgi:hypothetical protein